MYIKVTTLGLTLAVALVGIFLPTDNMGVKFALAGLAVASLILALFVEIQADQEGRFTKRVLERLIQATTPSSLFAEAVQQIAVRAASARTLPTCVVQTVSSQDGGAYRVKMIFLEQNEGAVEGIFCFDHQQLAAWSLLEPKDLEKTLIEDMFSKGPFPSGDLGAHWNDVADFLRMVAGALYPTRGPGPGDVLWGIGIGWSSPSCILQQ